MSETIKTPPNTTRIPTGGTEFKIECIEPGGGLKRTLKFPAYISNISNSFNGNWNEHNDMGHGHPKMMYSSHNQSIDVEFMIAAIEDTEKHENLVKALNALTDLTKPVYKEGQGFNGMLATLTIGKYIQGVYGFIESVSVSVDQDSPWSMRKELALPFYMNVSMTMRVLANKNNNRPWWKNSNGTFYDGNYANGFTDPVQGNSYSEITDTLGRGSPPEVRPPLPFQQLLLKSIGSSFKNALKQF